MTDQSDEASPVARADNPPLPREARELTPVQLEWYGGKGARDFGPRPVDAKVVLPEEEEVEVETVPKDESALESATLPESPPPTVPAASATPAPQPPPIPTPASAPQAADSENGKPSESSEAAPTTPTTTPPVPASSSPSSSSATSPGKNMPPVAVPLPTAASTQTP